MGVRSQTAMRVLSFTVLAASTGCVGERPQDTLPVQSAAPAIGASVRCIDPSDFGDRRIAGPRTLIFVAASGRTYRNDLPAACSGLDSAPRFKIIELEVYGSRVCSGDSFRAYDPMQARVVGNRAFPRCRLGAFTPIARRDGRR